MSRIWGHLFDRVNFFVLRIVLNIGFMVGILTFFMGGGWLSLVTGALVFGISVAGGDIAWSLWVTKIAPANRVAEYMSIHTFFTGIRGVIAPFLAFQLVQTLHPSVLAGFCAALIAMACLLLLPEARTIRVRRPAVPLLPEGED
jgi:MFS family permease